MELHGTRRSNHTAPQQDASAPPPSDALSFASEVLASQFGEVAASLSEKASQVTHNLSKTTGFVLRLLALSENRFSDSEDESDDSPLPPLRRLTDLPADGVVRIQPSSTERYPVSPEAPFPDGRNESEEIPFLSSNNPSSSATERVAMPSPPAELHLNAAASSAAATEEDLGEEGYEMVSPEDYAECKKNS